MLKKGNWTVTGASDVGGEQAFDGGGRCVTEVKGGNGFAMVVVGYCWIR